MDTSLITRIERSEEELAEIKKNHKGYKSVPHGTYTTGHPYDARQRANQAARKEQALKYIETLEIESGGELKLKRPSQGILNEKISHQMVIMLASTGMSAARIRDKLWENFQWTYSEYQIQEILKQPWAQEQLIAAAKDRKAAVELQLRAQLAEECLASIQTLIELRDNAKSESVRRSAANDILDRYLGKAEPIGAKTDVDELEKLTPEELDAHIAAAQADIKRLQPSPVNGK